VSAAPQIAAAQIVNARSAAPQTVPLRRRRRWTTPMPERSFWIFFGASLLFNFGFSAYFFLYNLYLVDLNYVEASIGRIMAAMSLGTVAGTLPVGMLAGRFGLRRTLLVCLPLASLASAARACLPYYTAQLAFAFVTGLTLCAWGVCLAPSVARLTNESTRPFAFSVIFASGIGMAGVGALSAGRLPALLQSAIPGGLQHTAISSLQAKQITLLLACAAAMLAVLPLASLRLGMRTEQARMLRRPHPFLLRFLPVIALWSFITSAFAPFATVYFTRHFTIPLERVSTIFSISQAAQCAGVLLAPFVLRLLGLGSSVMWTQLAAACGLAALAATHTASHAIWIYWVYIAMNYMSEPALFSLLMERVPQDQRSSASSMNMLVASLVQSFAAAIAGSAITRLGYGPVFCGLALCACASAILFRQMANSTAPDSRPGAYIHPERS
jgi:predicted MFS family arabinose efflux permease